ncbi:DEAD/DEAH box helicase [Corynebacterium sp. 319]|uniref:DEAD/DEAH box helicase n=1 Tax=unclassified Corynebacterium TaxID=2624378 RepID=UPI00125CCD3B|nr:MULTISPECIES: DEAD/DEAH box helicase [unclassified Corynebacterium]KAB1551695.1 DEAD/DEAH box helicase [Corynebacterium sp. 319]KAB3538685.1 DEAD/DEAH box helicase [Corynebacterium sp. 366]
MPADVLDRFHAPVAAWFRDVFAEPTLVQTQAWEAISAGDNALVVAPTGSGKTLAAFLWSLSTLTSSPLLIPSDLPQREGSDAAVPSDSTHTATHRGTGTTKVLYVSPLKALGVDVDRNLAVPLAGIARTADALGHSIAPVRVGVRSGDTPQAERAKLLRNPPDILITTPESLYLMLTSKAAGTLAGVETVIVDEVHAVAGTKRGAHLALSLERLEMVTGAPVQRIGLSATVNPIDTVASFLVGDRPVTVVNPPITKRWDVRVRSVVEDFQDPPPAEDLTDTDTDPAADPETDAEAPIDEALVGPSLMGEGLGGVSSAGSGARVASGVDKESALPQQRSVWPHVQRAIYQQVMDNQSTLVFVNSRRAAERLTGALNELWAAEHDPDSLAAPTRRDPAQLMAQSAQVTGAPAVIARAHHGSVSKEERADIEQALKSGHLKCVVATSSLELGIDMGLVDHVVQVGAPPSVASAVQRCGRAGHTVGATSSATIYPLHKQDAEAAVVVVDRMLKGQLEPLHVVTNALDVLAQQTVAAAVQALGGRLDVEQWWTAVRRALCYSALPREAFDGVIELISGHYPSTDFADLKPRVTYDATAGVLEARPGTQRIAVTTGGTIPDRGMFGVFLAAGSETGARRVGELDEEMVYESRVGDVFTLGASSWKILEITRDQVIVTPAAGHTGRLPFWTGDAEGRPVELGQAIGEHRRQWGTGQLGDIKGQDFLDEYTIKNLDTYYAAQKDSAGLVPDEKTILIERFKDDIGDWRVVIHSPYGRGVNAPWAMALAAQIQAETGVDAMAVAGDDGLVLRVPYSDTPPGLELVLGSGPAEERASTAVADVMDNVGSSALFAGRFRECAARALLLPRRNPGKRQPLWQQRQRAAQLLDVARNHPEFPIMVETMRECIHDVYSMDALRTVLTALEERGAPGGAIRVAEVTTDGPSAFAESLLFSYTGAFMYEGDSAERAAALAVDPVLLAQVLGTSSQSHVLDPAVVGRVVEAAQWLAEGRRAASAEQAIDMLRSLGPLTLEEIARRIEPWAEATEHLTPTGVSLAQLEELIPRRLMRISFGAQTKLAVVEDMPLLRDGLGVPVPPGVVADARVIPDALDQLLLRWLRHRGPSSADEAAQEFGMGVAAAQSLLSRWVSQKRLERVEDSTGTGMPLFVDVAMLRRLRSASLAAARGAVEPVAPEAYARFLQVWHGLATQERGDLLNVIEQLAGVALPASAWETVVLPARIPDYQPGDLDELLSSGDVIAVGSGVAGSADSWITLLPADMAPALLHLRPQEESALSMLALQITTHVDAGGAFLASELATALGTDAGAGVAEAAKDLIAAMWELFDAGLITPDSFAPIRARLAEAGTSGGRQAHRAPRRDRGRGSQRRVRLGRRGFTHGFAAEAATARRNALAASARSTVPGRWSALPRTWDITSTELAAMQGETWIERYAVVTRGAVMAEKASGGFAEAYRLLSAWEDSGSVLRGYIIEGLGGAQFAPRDVIGQLRDAPEHTSEHVPDAGPAEPIVLATLDPANPYGAALPWPSVRDGATTPTRSAGSLVVLHGGELLAWMSRGGKNISVMQHGVVDESQGDQPVDSAVVEHIVGALQVAVHAGRLSPILVERIDGVPVLDADLRPWTRAGARLVPKGLSIK